MITLRLDMQVASVWLSPLSFSSFRAQDEALHAEDY